MTRHTSTKYYGSMILIHMHGTDFWTRSKKIRKTDWAMGINNTTWPLGCVDASAYYAF